jgi:hypothetical protein
MASFRQQNLAFVNKHNNFLRVKGKELIHHTLGGIHERSRKMKLMGSGRVAHYHTPSLNGGTIKYHDRPYQLKDRAVVEHKQNKKFAPIHFKL